MKNLFLLFVIAMIHGCGCAAFAQLTPNTQTYFEYLPTSVNLIKNPSARLNKNNVTATGTVTVTNVAASGNNPSYFTLGAISTLGYAEFALNPVKSKDTSGSCEFKGQYFGTEASKYSARIFNNTTEILKVTLKNTTSDLPGGGPWGEFSVGAPCSSTPKVRIYADAVGLVLNVTNLYYDKATNIGTYTSSDVVGDIIPSAKGTCRANTLPANGAAVSRATYPALFAAIGITHGQGDGSTTFNVPDYRGRTLRMVDGGIGRDPDRAARTAMNTGGVTGDNVGSVQTDAIVSHNHVSGFASGSVSTRYGITNTGASGYAFDQQGATSDTNGANSSSVGGNETRMKNANVNYCIVYSSGDASVVRPETPRTPNVIRYTSTGPGTYTPTPGTKYITVELCGGGGGGSGSSTSSANAGPGGNGGATTLGSSLLTASGGGGGVAPGSGSIGGSGGSTTVNSPAVSFKNLNGANGSASSGFATSTFSAPGGSSPFGGAGSGTFATLAGISAVANSCSGGGGAGGNAASSVASGSGGGAGGYILAKIDSPSGSYPYTVGAGGTPGTAGSSGYAGGAGGSGVIIITEYFSSDVNAIIAGTEQAHGIFYNVAGTTIGTVATQVPYTTVAPGNQNKNVDWDATNTCARVNVAGIYSISGTALMGNASYPAGEYHMQINVSRPTVETIVQQFNFTSGTTGYMPVSATANGVYLPAQSCIAVFIYQSSGANKALHVGSSRVNMLSISKTGYLQ